MTAAEHYESHYPVEPLEWCDRAGADALKRKIAAHWKGHKIVFATVAGPFTASLRASRFDVRSDMVNGLPRAVFLARAKAGRGP